MGDSKSVKIHLPLDEDGTNNGDAVSFTKDAATTGDTKEKKHESLNNAMVLSGPAALCNGGGGAVAIAAAASPPLRKVPNGGADGGPPKRPTIQLTHLPPRPPVDIAFQSLSYSVAGGRRRRRAKSAPADGQKTILKGVQGRFRSGDLTGIMGPSGAGKSTLMNILAGYKTSNVSGQVLINGRERNLRRFRKLSCYIMQDDCLSPHLTVREALQVSANLKLGGGMRPSEKRVVIGEIEEALGLQDCVDTLSSSLSGGQRKRLSIALELVNNPPVMFFDEPTSGLDSSSCFQCLCLLKSLARGGRTVICTIHQPSARLFEMFDHLYVLAEGRCIYRGAVAGLVPFLGSLGLHCPGYHNPADYVMEVACGEHGEYVDKLVVAVDAGRCRQPPPTLALEDDIAKGGGRQDGWSPAANPPPSCTTSLLDSAEQLAKADERGFPTSGFRQFLILLRRSVFTILRDRTLTRLRLASHLVIGVLIGIIYYDVGGDAAKVTSNAGCLFFTVMFMMFTAMMPTILTFPMEMSVFVREHLNYWYSLKAYYFAKTLADIPFQIVMTMGYVIGVYFITSQPLDATRFAMFLAIAVLTALVSQSFGLLVGAGFNIEGGVFLGPISTIPMVLFSGFFARLEDISYYVRWVPYLSYVKYSFEGVMVAIYGLNRPKLDCGGEFCYYRNPSKFLKEMGMGDDMRTYAIDVVVLVGLFVVLRVCAYFVLRIRLFQQR